MPRSQNPTKKRARTTLNVDLNLLVVLQALLEEKSVTKAAARVCLSQPATSAALSRLRDVFEDPLLVRFANKMELSRLAMDLVDPVNEAIIAINKVLGEPLPFDPTLAHTTVRIGASDYIGITLLPKLEREIQSQAPGIDLHISPLREPEILRRLEREDVDIVIGNFGEVPHLNTTKLFVEKFICVMREHHPLAQKDFCGPLSLKEFISYPHVSIAREREGGPVDTIDQWLSDYDIERKIGIRVPHFLVAPGIVAENDMISVEAQRVYQSFKDSLKLAARELPAEFGTGELPIHMVWEPHTEHDPALQWIRGLITKVAKEI